MNLDKYKIKTKHRDGGVQHIYRFDNGYGASMIKTQYSYGGDRGLWEIGVITFDSNGGCHLCYDTTVTSDVIGHLTDDEAADILQQIKELT